jgi:nucleotide-binding universal stress UspA family protein
MTRPAQEEETLEVATTRTHQRISELRRTGAAGIEHILVCLDRSALSESCVPHAVALARVFDARITLLHVMEVAHGATALPDPLGWEIARQEAQTYLDKLRDRTEALGPPTRTVIAQGIPASRIVSVATDVGADLTVLGSHGASGRVDSALGTTVQQVLAFTRGSVFVAHSSSSSPTAKAAAAGADVVAPRRILVPLDGSTRTECVLPTATRIAQRYGAEIIFVHVVAEPQPSAILSGDDLGHARDLARRLAAAAERYLRQTAHALTREGLVVRTIVLRESDERQALLALAEREHVDLMVVSAHGTTCNAARPFGTVASYLLSHARAALLVIQDLRAAEHRTDDEGGGGGGIDNEHHASPLRGIPHTGPAEGET